MPTTVERQRATIRLMPALMSQAKNEAKKGHVSFNRYIESLIINAVACSQEQTHKQALVFPKLPKDYKISEATEKLPLGTLPQDVSFEQETEKMWEEMAR